jgi:hypothetical protein
VGTALTLRASGDSGGGALSYTVANGTATGCVVRSSLLSASTKGTCVVTALRAANGSNPGGESAPTSVTFAARIPPPSKVTVDFTGTSASLDAGARSTLLALVKRLFAGASLTITGYAFDNASLATSRAEAVEQFVLSHVKVHVSLHHVINLDAARVVVTT